MSERVVSPGDMDAERDRPLLAWSVRWVLSVGARKPRKGARLDICYEVAMGTSQGKTFVLYRRQMLALLRFPKPAFDQLAIELPCLMGFRSQEVATWMAEYIDYQTMNTFVLDSKKKALFTVPLNLYVAKHAEEVLNGRDQGYVLRHRTKAKQFANQPLTPTAIWYIWDKWTKLAKLWNAKDISPNTGRRFFAAEWYYSQELSLVTLQMILRHSHFETTMRYVRGLVFYEDMKRDYDRFQFRIMEEMQKQKVLV